MKKNDKWKVGKHAQKKNGLHDLMEIMLESMMVAERSEFLVDNPDNKGNGYRPGSAYGHGRKLQFRIPRDRYGNFHPQILAKLWDRNQGGSCWAFREPPDLSSLRQAVTWMQLPRSD